MTDEIKLTSERVSELFTDCLFKDASNVTQYIPAPGIMRNVGFDPAKIDKYREEIIALCDELPIEFHMPDENGNGGGGWSFLNICFDKNRQPWTSLHQTMEQLLQLGIATGKLEIQLPREMWSILPGGLPYIVVLRDPKTVKIVDIVDFRTAKGIAC